MTLNELAEAWPDHAGTHDISDAELARIAKAATCVEQADAIWENESWWADPEPTEQELLDLGY